MAKNNNNNRNNNMGNNNVTRVVCSNCGAEIIIPNDEIKHVVGTVIGQNSGMGTIVLPTKGCGCGNHEQQGQETVFHSVKTSSTVNGERTTEHVEMRVKHGGDISAAEALEKLKSIAQFNPDMMGLVNEISGKIEEGGYIDVQGIVRRWIPSQFLNMLYSEKGFQNALNWKGYNYSWNVLEKELHRLFKDMVNGDEEDYMDRLRWYNRELVLDMMEDYVLKLKKHVESLTKKHCEGKEYVKVPCGWLNNGKGVFTAELYKLYAPFETIIKQVEQSSTIDKLYNFAIKFGTLRAMVHWTPEYNCNSFNNAYKAAGAYYTLKDLILFEGCGMIASTLRANGQTRIQLADQECSLSMLEDYVDDLVENKNIFECGYMLLGYAKRFLEVNKFNFKATKEKWAGQSKARREARRNNRVNRRIK